MSDGVVRGRQQNRGRVQQHRAVPDQRRATIVNHVINHDLTMDDHETTLQGTI